MAVCNMFEQNGLQVPADPGSWTFAIWSTIEGERRITELALSGRSLTGELDVSGLTALTKLDISNNAISGITGLNSLHSLDHLNLEHNQVEDLDVSGNTALTVLNAASNQLAKLNVQYNTNLEELYCDGNQLTRLNVSQNKALTTLYCQSNQLTNLDVSGCTSLTELYCQNCALTDLDLSGSNSNLQVLDCERGNNIDIDIASLNLNETSSTFVYFGNSLNASDISSDKSVLQILCQEDDEFEIESWNGQAIS